MNLFRELKDDFLEKNLKITYIENKLDILNYSSIGSFDSSKIIVNYNSKMIVVTGDNLVISRLMTDEVLICGNITKLEFR